MFWLNYVNFIQLIVIYLVLDTGLKMKNYFFVCLLGLICVQVDKYSFFAMLLIFWGGIYLISFSNEPKIRRSVSISLLVVSINMAVVKIIDLIFSITDLNYDIKIEMVLYLIIAIPLSVLLRQFIMERILNNEIFFFFTTIVMVVWGIHSNVENYFFYFSSTMLTGIIISIIFGLTIILFIIILFLYRKTLLLRVKKEQENLEYQHLQEYIREIEKYNSEVKKFRHDYQNILSSLELFIMNNDMKGINDYFQNSIKNESLILNQNINTISDLKRIKMLSIKSILANKLLQAQSKGIDVLFEATEDIQLIEVDAVVLVRIFGIILDNAIEEVETLSEGEVRVAAFYEGENLTFIFENTCRNDIGKIHDIVRPGISTKGPERGNGLSILSELTSKSESIYLETRIDKNLFIQKLTIL